MDMQTEFQVAARWWRDVLAGPPRKDNGDGLQSMMMTALSRDGAPSEQLDTFQAALLGVLESEQERYYGALWERSPQAVLFLDVDYHPDRLLSKAAEAAGLDCGLLGPFPSKTVMHIAPGKVSVACGYGRPFETLYEGEAAHDR